MLSRQFALIATTLLTLASSQTLVMQPSTDPQSSFAASNGGPNLVDRLSISRATIFSDYLRDNVKLSTALISPVPKHTVLVPLNAEIMALARKPHEGKPRTDGADDQPDIESSAEQQEKSNAKYLQRWLELHVISGDVLESAPDDDPDRQWNTLVPGRTVQFVEQQDGSMRVMPGDIVVDRVEKVRHASGFFLTSTKS